MRWLACGLALLLAASPCAAQPVVMRVTVLASGAVYVDGRPVSISELNLAFGQLAQQGGAVWYYREAPASEPPAAANEVIQLVTTHQLPIRMSMQPDFSDMTEAERRPWTQED